jgi:hypothetical protein
MLKLRPRLARPADTVERHLNDQPAPLWQRLAERPWFLAGIALLPLYCAYLAHFLGATQGSLGTGFLQYDQPYYMANAREHFDGGFHLLYGLPFSPDYDTPRIYFQPQTLFLGLAWQITGSDPGLIYVVFGLAAAFVFFRIAIALYCAVVGLTSLAEFFVLLTFLWGGGIMVVAAVVVMLVVHSYVPLFAFDPFDGYWFLNLGRNVFYSVEAYYHAVFLGAMLLLTRRLYLGALIMMVLLCASHPFTGLELAAIVLVWTIYESISRKPEAPPLWFGSGTAILLGLHVAYYLILLPRLSPEHAVLEAQWTLPWVLHLDNIFAAYGPVGLAALWRLRDRQRISSAIADRNFRLLIAWFAVAFLLANHELFVTARQPLHFTRGYIWTPLFLIGAPTMVEIVERILAMPLRRGWAVLAPLLGLALLDNAAWFGRFGIESFLHMPVLQPPVLITRDARDVLERLDAPAFADGLVVSDAPLLPYLVTVYTPLRAWYSHVANTPYARQRRAELNALFHAGTDLDEWRHRKMIAVVEKDADPDARPRLLELGYRPAYENTQFLVLLRPAVAE